MEECKKNAATFVSPEPPVHARPSCPRPRRITFSRSFLNPPKRRHKMMVAFIGGGSWGTAAARRVALNIHVKNVQDHKKGKETMYHYNNHVNIWINTDSVIDGRPLTTIINTDRENVKYLPGIKLPPNLHATTDLVGCVRNADVLFFTIPHQFLPDILLRCQGHVKPACIAVSLTKGLNSGPDGPQLLSDMIKDLLALDNDVAVVMGANIAGDVARDQFAETTVGCRNPAVAEMIVDLLDAPCFRASPCSNVSTVELCGAVKNVIAFGAGFCDALGLGSSTKAAVLRRGLSEMLDFCAILEGPSFEVKTVLHSCCVADTIATAMGGRNRRCAEAFAKKLLLSLSPRAEQAVMGDSLAPPLTPTPATILTSTLALAPPPPPTRDPTPTPTPASALTANDLQNLWDDIEQGMLRGQKLQGLTTTRELMECLVAKGLHKERSAERKHRPYHVYTDRTTGGVGWSDRSAHRGAEGWIHGSDEVNLAEAGLRVVGCGEGLAVCTGNERESSDDERQEYELRFGLFVRIHAIACCGADPHTLFDW